MELVVTGGLPFGCPVHKYKTKGNRTKKMEKSCGTRNAVFSRGLTVLTAQRKAQTNRSLSNLFVSLTRSSDSSQPVKSDIWHPICPDQAASQAQILVKTLRPMPDAPKKTEGLSLRLYRLFVMRIASSYFPMVSNPIELPPCTIV